MINMMRINGDDFYLCRVVGLLKNDGTFKQNAEHNGLFAYMRPAEGDELPAQLKGVTEDENGKTLPVAIHNDVQGAVQEAFYANAGVLVRIQSIRSLGISVIDAAISLASALASDKRYQ